MRTSRRNLALAAAVIAGCFLLPAPPADAGSGVRLRQATSRVPSTDVTPTTAEMNPAMNRPHYWAWKRFIEINRTNPATGGTTWESWASDSETFPECPDADAPPSWPGPANRLKVLRDRAQVIEAESDNSLSWYTLEDGVPTAQTVEFPEEVRRNQATFEYIVNNGFYYTEGLASAFDEAAAKVAAAEGSTARSMAAIRRVVNFPIESVEIKAEWIPLQYVPEADRSSYYTAEAVTVDGDGNTTTKEAYALVSLHISTKDIPAWFWATWVNEKVLGRCDYIGCTDTFGTTPPYQAPNDSPNYPYSPPPLNPKLVEMMRSAGLDSVFENYRLVGAQTNFVDFTGQSTLLSNVIAEQGNVQTGSCMGCHSRAGFDSTGAPNSVVSDTASGETPLTGDSGVTNNGAPDTTWYWTSENGVDEDENTVDYSSSGTEITGLTSVQFDFVWGLLFANSVDACD